MLHPKQEPGPDTDPKPTEKQDPDPEKIIPDPQHYQTQRHDFTYR